MPEDYEVLNMLGRDGTGPAGPGGGGGYKSEDYICRTSI